jgi:hypothetical protein
MARWRAAVDVVKAEGARQGASLAHARLLAVRAGSVTVGFTKEAGFHRVTVTSPASKALIERALSQHFGQAIALQVDPADLPAEATGPSLAEQDAHARAEHERSTGGKVREHPAVRAALRLLGGEIEHIQVLEKERPQATAPDAPEEPG